MKEYRLNRLFNARSGRCFDVAVDHGFFNQPGFLTGIESMPSVVKTLGSALRLRSRRGSRGKPEDIRGGPEEPASTARGRCLIPEKDFWPVETSSPTT
jgi:hypothetical protein